MRWKPEIFLDTKKWCRSLLVTHWLSYASVRLEFKMRVDALEMKYCLFCHFKNKGREVVETSIKLAFSIDFRAHDMI